jgi:hypothetical protein
MAQSGSVATTGTAVIAAGESLPHRSAVMPASKKRSVDAAQAHRSSAITRPMPSAGQGAKCVR